MLYICWLLFQGALEQTQDQLGRGGAGHRRVDGHRLRVGVVFAVLAGRPAAARPAARWSPASITDDDLVMVKESEEAVQLEADPRRARRADTQPGARHDHRSSSSARCCVAMALGIPIAFALLVSGVALMWHLDMFDAQILAQNLIDGADSFPLLAVPFFMLAGEIMNVGGLSQAHRRLRAGAGRPHQGRPGLRDDHRGLPAVGAVGLGGGRRRRADRAAAADDGRRPATTRRAPAGLIAAGRRHRAGDPAAASASSSSASPPTCRSPSCSWPASARPADRRRAVAHLGVAGAHARRSCRRRASRAPRCWRPLREATWALVLPVIILVGLRMGVFTPTEAAVVAAVYALFVSTVDLPRAEAVAAVRRVRRPPRRPRAVVMFLVAAAMVSAPG